MSRHRSTRLKQLSLPFQAGEVLRGTVIVVVTSDLDLATDAGCETCLLRMLAVPLDKSILLDFLVGRQRGEDRGEEKMEWARLQALLNSRYRSRRFDYFGDSLTAQLFRESLRTMDDWWPVPGSCLSGED